MLCKYHGTQNLKETAILLMALNFTNTLHKIRPSVYWKSCGKIISIA